jgi:tellurite resistance protein TerB
MLGFLRNSPDLQVFDTNEIIDIYDRLMNSFEFDMEVGKGESNKLILALKSSEEEAQLAIRVGISVAKSDGNFDDLEKATLREIISMLGQNTSAFSL